MKKQFILIGSMLLMLLASPAWADAAMPSNNINLDGLLNTVWVAGDYRPVAEVFNSIGMFFSGGEKSIWRGLLFLGAIIGLTMAITRLAFGGKMADIGQWLMATVIMSMFFLPRTDVKIASYYTASSGNQAGAVAFRKVDNIPIGLVLPLALTTNIGKSITELYDTSFQVLPNALTNSAAAAGNSYSFMYRGQEGFFSPLKLALKTVNYYPSDPLFAKNMNAAMSSCNWRQRTPDFAKYGAFGLLMPDDKSKNSGMTNWTYRDAEGRYVTDQIFCNAAGYLLSLQVLSDFAPNADGSSYMSSVLASTQSLNVADKGSPDMTQVSKKIATELAVLPELVAGAINGGSGAEEMNPARLKALQEHVLNQKGMGNIPDTYRTFIASREVNATFVKASMAFNRLVANCLNAKDEYSCAQETSIMFDAGQNALVQSAGEASMFQRFSTGTQNILLVVYIAMSPIIMFMIMLMGVKGIKLAGSYLMFCIWIASWMPLTNVIASYMMKNYISNIEAIGSTLRGDPARILSPAVLQNIMQSTGDMIASASSMMAYVPTIMLTLLSGSIYGMVSLAQRASMTGKDYIDETKTTPNLESSRSLDVDGRVKQHLNENAGIPSPGYLSTPYSKTQSEIDGIGSVNVGWSADKQEALKETARNARKIADEEGTSRNVGTTYTDSHGITKSIVWAVTKDGTEKAMTSDEASKSEDVVSYADLSAGGEIKAGIATPFASAQASINARWGGKSHATFSQGGKEISAKEFSERLSQGNQDGLSINNNRVSQDSFSHVFSQRKDETNEVAKNWEDAASVGSHLKSDVNLNKSAVRDIIASSVRDNGGELDDAKAKIVGTLIDEGASNQLIQSATAQNSIDGLSNVLMAGMSSGGGRDLVNSSASLKAVSNLARENPAYENIVKQSDGLDRISDVARNVKQGESFYKQTKGKIDGANIGATAQKFEQQVENGKVAEAKINAGASYGQNAATVVNDLTNLHSNVNQSSKQISQEVETERSRSTAKGVNDLGRAGDKALKDGAEYVVDKASNLINSVPRQENNNPKFNAPVPKIKSSSMVTGAVKDNFGQSFLSALRNTRSSSSQVPYRLPESGDNVSSNISNGGNRIYSGVQSVGATRHYIRHDGTLETRMGGSRAWRNNNPGNLEYGALAKKHGAIGHDGRFAIFPSKEAGDNARRDLIFRGKNYKNLNLFQAINRYAPASENKTNLYYQAVKSAVGSNKQMKDYTPQEQQKILDAMNRVEGNKAGKVVLSRSKTSGNNRA